MSNIGISGLSIYVPPYRVGLEQWCDWSGQPWSKIQAVVGRSFRMRGPNQNVYTMAANAALRLIQAYDIDPSEIGMLALGTESSTDNSAGAIIVKGMLDEALLAQGSRAIRRHCEVPEFKHACLGGVYAMKAAARYLAYDGQGKKAIVVCADVAEYARGSSGEPTQGAGAVAMLLEADPKLLELHLDRTGSASDYRGPDFRKPFMRFTQQSVNGSHELKDFPVFNGKYSTTCYIDEVISALDDLFDKRAGSRSDYLRALPHVFMHRPYARMPQNGWALGYLFALAQGQDGDRNELASYAAAAGVDVDALIEEMRSRPRVFDLVEAGRIEDDVYPRSLQVLRSFRSSPTYNEVVEAKMSLGGDRMMDIGNLYTAALPAWLAAGLEEAAEAQEDLAGREVLTVGYGSGDAAEAIPMTVRPTWREAARKIGFSEALTLPVDLVREQYEALHDARPVELPPVPSGEFVIERVGKAETSDLEEHGVEYYGRAPV